MVLGSSPVDVISFIILAILSFKFDVNGKYNNNNNNNNKIIIIIIIVTIKQTKQSLHSAWFGLWKS